MIAVSEFIRKELIRAGLPDARIVTIHNAVDVNELQTKVNNGHRDWRSWLKIDPDQPVVSLIGRLVLQKGHHDFLTAAVQVLKTLPDARFLVVGDGPLRPELEELTRSLGIDKVVHFLGHQSDVFGLLAISDVVALPSLNEGLPYVLLEALALSRPVVATPVGGIPEVISHGETGLIVPVRAPEALATAICHLLENPHKAEELSKRGQLHVIKTFSLPVMARRVAEVYRDVLSSTQNR